MKSTKGSDAELDATPSADPESRDRTTIPPVPRSEGGDTELDAAPSADPDCCD